MKVIGRGAEAVLTLDKDIVIKERIKKGYRHPDIDSKIRKYCTRREAKILDKAKDLISVPKIYNSSDKDMKIEMQFIDGKVLRDYLDKEKDYKKICKIIGEQIAILHDNDIIHGDLTTSNFILKENKVYFIDFGLGFFSTKAEDKAVDLHLLRQALESKHYQKYEEYYNSVIEGYKKSKNFKQTIERLEQVEKRGRYKRKKH